MHSGSTQRPNFPIPNQQGQSTLVHHQHQQSLKQQHYAHQSTPSQPGVQQQQIQSHQMQQHHLMNRPSSHLSHDAHVNMGAKAQSRTSSSSGGTTVHYPISNSIASGQQISIVNNNNNTNTNNNNGSASANSINNQKQEQRLTHEQVCIEFLRAIISKLVSTLFILFHTQ